MTGIIMPESQPSYQDLLRMHRVLSQRLEQQGRMYAELESRVRKLEEADPAAPPVTGDVSSPPRGAFREQTAYPQKCQLFRLRQQLLELGLSIAGTKTPHYRDEAQTMIEQLSQRVVAENRRIVVSSPIAPGSARRRVTRMQDHEA
jgi:hypothetical protein